MNFPLLVTRENTHLPDYVIMFSVTVFLNWKYVAILAGFVATVKLSERKYFCE